MVLVCKGDPRPGLIRTHGAGSERQQRLLEGCGLRSADLRCLKCTQLTPCTESLLGTEDLTAYTENDAVCLLNVAAQSQRRRLVSMFALTRNRLDAGVLPLWNAVFCLDCEVISSSRGDECPACKSRSLVSLSRILGGSLLAHRVQQSQGWEGGVVQHYDCG
jgi:hypothetical protein